MSINCKKNIKQHSTPAETGIENFEWPIFTSDAERIKNNTLKYSDLEIPEAFSDFYNIKCNPKLGVSSNYISSVNIGDILTLEISSITKKNTIFNSDKFDKDIISSINLYQYQKFYTEFNLIQNANKNIKKHIELECKVIYIDEYTIKVDPIIVLYDKFLNRITQNIKQQYSVKEDKSILVQQLQWIRGGFIGFLRIDELSDIFGEDMYNKVFIPGSHIALNIEKDFDKWIGKDVNVFIYNYMPENKNTNKPTIICSRKKYLEHQGNLNKINIFNEYCLNSQEWLNIQNIKYNASVTGILNSSKNCGIFVEVSELNITGLIKMSADIINTYHPGDNISIRISNIEEITYYNYDTKQLQHTNPVNIDNDILKSCKLNFIFEIY